METSHETLQCLVLKTQISGMLSLNPKLNRKSETLNPKSETLSPKPLANPENSHLSAAFCSHGHVEAYVQSAMGYD